MAASDLQGWGASVLHSHCLLHARSSHHPKAAALQQLLRMFCAHQVLFCACRIILSRTAGWRHNQPLGEMMGLSAHKLPTATAAQQSHHLQQQSHTHTHRASLSQQQPKQPPSSLTLLKQHQLQEAAFVPMQACEVEWELPGDVPLLLVPCTYAPGVIGAFSLSVTTSNCRFSCESVPGGVAALLAASGARITRGDT
jgi:hypothetical protein